MPTLNSSPAPQMPPLPDGPSLDRIRGPVEVPMFETWQLLTASIIGAIFIGLILWYFVKSLRNRSARNIPLSPKAAALNQLNSASQIYDNDEAFAVQISAALRDYFDANAKLSSKGCTSKEFLCSLKENTDIDDGFKRMLEQFLTSCDAIKFARQSSSTEQRAALIDIATQLIEISEKTKEEE